MWNWILRENLDACQSCEIYAASELPGDDYTPFGYVDNPAHTAVLNPSGVLRTVPPMGLGYWLRALPFPYSTSVARKLNYLSFLRLTLVIDGVAFHTSADFQRNGVRLVSRYHTKTLLSYDWEFRGMQVSAKYALSNENALLCLLEIGNSDAAQHDCMVHVINDYGYPHERYWGSDGVRSSYAAKDDVGISKFWAYGDIFVVGADRACAAYKATPFEDELSDWVRRNDLRSNDGALISFRPKSSRINRRASSRPLRLTTSCFVITSPPFSPTRCRSRREMQIVCSSASRAA